MCWMSIYTGSNPVTDAFNACSRHECHSGGHSSGLAVVADGEITFSHGLGKMPDGVPDEVDGLDADMALAHTRYATRGDITIENAHPFPVENSDGEVVAALAHNGTWYDAPEGTDRCDSYYIAQLLESTIRFVGSFRNAVKTVGKATGETITVVHRDGTGYTYSGRFDITVGDDCVQSTGGISIPDGEVIVV